MCLSYRLGAETIADSILSIYPSLYLLVLWYITIQVEFLYVAEKKYPLVSTYWLVQDFVMSYLF